MKVCFVVSTYEPDTTGGQGEVVFKLQQNLQELSVDSYVLTSGSNVPGYVRTSRTGCGKRLFYAASAAYFGWFKKMDFDIINVHHESGMGILPFLVASRTRAKIVTTLHTSYLSESRALRSLPGVQKEYGSPTFDEYAVKYLLTPFKFLGTALDCSVSDRIIAVCQKTREECRVDYHIPEHKMTVIHNGVNISEFNPHLSGDRIRSKYSLVDKPIILSVGCGTIRKGIPYLIQSMKGVRDAIPDARLIVVGPTSYRRQLLLLTRDLGLEESVIFPGKVPREELPYYYAACDVVALPSLQEGFPVVALEAMSSGKPIVAARVGGIPEAVNDKTGILVEPGNTKELTGALTPILRNQGLRVEMGRQARLEAESKYDWKKIAGTYLTEFQHFS